MADSTQMGLLMLNEAEDLGDEEEEDCAATVAMARVTKLTNAPPTNLSHNYNPLHTLLNLNVPTPATDIPPFDISSLTNYCFSDNYPHYKHLYDIQSSFLSKYAPAYPIHSLTAINFYDVILKAPPFVLNTLTYGYRPGRL